MLNSHYPFLWKFRLLHAIRAKGSKQNRRFLGAWARAEGGTAKFNPLNTTEPWQGATDYNPQGVKNYPSGAAGIAATAMTLCNGHYPGIVNALRAGFYPAEKIVQAYRAEIGIWGTNANLILSILKGS